MLKRRLILRIVDENSTRTNFTVAEQSHIRYDFNPYNPEKADCYIKKIKGQDHCILSAAGPEIQVNGTNSIILYVRGTDPGYDNCMCKCATTLFNNVVAPLVLGYNQQYSRNTLAREDVIWNKDD